MLNYYMDLFIGAKFYLTRGRSHCSSEQSLGLQLFKKKIRYSWFPVNIAKFLKAVFFIEHFWWMPLNLWTS